MKYAVVPVNPTREMLTYVDEAQWIDVLEQASEASEDAVKSALQAVERLANTNMDMSLKEWHEVSTAILNALGK